MDENDVLGITPELRTCLVGEAGKSGEAQRESLKDSIFGLEAMFSKQNEDDPIRKIRRTPVSPRLW